MIGFTFYDEDKIELILKTCFGEDNLIKFYEFDDKKEPFFSAGHYLNYVFDSLTLEIDRESGHDYLNKCKADLISYHEIGMNTIQGITAIVLRDLTIMHEFGIQNPELWYLTWMGTTNVFFNPQYMIDLAAKHGKTKVVQLFNEVLEYGCPGVEYFSESTKEYMESDDCLELWKEENEIRDFG